VALVPRSQRWRTTFKHKSHRYCLGTFSSAEEAARVWDLAAIKSRAPDFDGLNFPRESYAYEIELLERYSLEETLHMLKVKLIDAKRSGRAVKRKLDNALEEERARADVQVPSSADTSLRPENMLVRTATRKGSLTPADSTAKAAGGNPFCKRTLRAKRSRLAQDPDEKPQNGTAGEHFTSAPAALSNEPASSPAAIRCALHLHCACSALSSSN
jgi:hypothetical protein